MIMEKRKFPLVILDWANINGAISVLTQQESPRIDFKSFRRIILGEERAPVSRTRIYCALPPVDLPEYRESILGFQRYAKVCKWYVVCKEMEWDTVEPNKLNGNLDIRIAIDVSRFLTKHSATISRLVLISGDGDFDELIYEAHAKNISVTVIASHHNLAGKIRRILREGTDQLIMLETILPGILINGQGSDKERTASDMVREAAKN